MRRPLVAAIVVGAVVVATSIGMAVAWWSARTARARGEDGVGCERISNAPNAGFTRWLTRRDSALVAAIRSSSIYAHAVMGFKRVTLPDDGVFYATGDVLLSEEELVASLISPAYVNVALESDERHTLDWQPQSTAALANLLVTWDSNLRAIGNVVLWKERSHLYYVVDSESFPGTRANEVRAALSRASDDWFEASGIRWDSVPALEPALAKGWPQAPELKDVEFIVRYVGRGADGLDGEYALGFFPGSPRLQHVLRITPGFFDQTEYTLEGLLRHELGHIMGFVDERGRAGGGLSAVDPASIMFLAIDPSLRRPIDLKLDRVDRDLISVIYPR